jgi:cyclophilin family peptidyl-prolyl cis-trans isomerase/HEAT repeat protein
MKEYDKPGGIAISLILFVMALAVAPSWGQSSNKFNDSVIRRIHDLADRRDAEGLLPYLGNPDPNYRGEALFCMGSVQAAGMVDTIFTSMQVPQERVRMIGAWALGQSGHPSAVPVLRRVLEKETNELVRGMCYEALGKTGTEEDLNFIAAFECPLAETEGQSMGIFRFGLRGITSVAGNARMLKLVTSGTSLAGSIYASYFLGRYAGMDWLQTVPVEIELAYMNERNQEVRSNLIKAVIRAKDEEAWLLAKNILDSDVDYREKVNLLNSMVLMPWNKASKTVFQFVAGADPNLSVAAAEAVQRHAVYTDLTVLLKSIDATVNWRSRSLILGKTLELVMGKAALVKKVENLIFQSVNSAVKPSEKAWYLKALLSDPGQYHYVELILNAAKDPVVATAALETLTEMRKNINFAEAAKVAAASGVDLESEYLRIFKKAIQTGDVPSVALSAAILRDPKLNFKEKISDTGFLEEALVKVNQPEKIEAFVELNQTLAYLRGQAPLKPLAPAFNHPINWQTVSRLAPKQKVAIKTSKGDFVVQLNVTWCPGTSAAFVEMAESGFYKNFTIHRVVPNFVMQDGCPRGDGWGAPGFTIRSEFTPTPFMEGTLGMASSGKDTEGSQWYVTHSATPHLDARYTNFGFVLEGMETVHKLEVGDTIIGMELLKD